MKHLPFVVAKILLGVMETSVMFMNSVKYIYCRLSYMDNVLRNTKFIYLSISVFYKNTVLIQRIDNGETTTLPCLPRVKLTFPPVE